jgi:hypothetical protein
LAAWQSQLGEQSSGNLIKDWYSWSKEEKDLFAAFPGVRIRFGIDENPQIEAQQLDKFQSESCRV